MKTKDIKILFLLFFQLEQVTIILAMPAMDKLPCTSLTEIYMGSVTKLNDNSGVIITYKCGTTGTVQKIDTSLTMSLLSSTNTVAQSFPNLSQSIHLSNENIVIVSNDGSPNLGHGLISAINGSVIKSYATYTTGLIMSTVGMAAFPSGGYVISWVIDFPSYSLNLQQFTQDGNPTGTLISTGTLSGVGCWSLCDVFPTSENIIAAYNRSNTVYLRIFSKAGSDLCGEYQVSNSGGDAAQVQVKAMTSISFVICWGLGGVFCQTYSVSYSQSCVITKLLSAAVQPGTSGWGDGLKLIKYSDTSFLIAFSEQAYIKVYLYSMSGTVLGKTFVYKGDSYCHRLQGAYFGNLLVLSFDTLNGESFYTVVNATFPQALTCSDYTTYGQINTFSQLDFSQYISSSSLNIKVSFPVLQTNIFTTTNQLLAGMYSPYDLTELSYAYTSIEIFQIDFLAIQDNQYLTPTTCKLTIKVCFISCKTCKDTPGNDANHQCLTCAADYYPLSDQPSICFPNDPNYYYYYYFNNVEQKYKPCNVLCYQCFGDGASGSQECISCESSSSYMYNDNCLVQCPTYTISDTNAKKCINCKSLNQFFYKGACVTAIPPNTWLLDSNFNAYEDCYLTCASCIGTGDDSNHLCITCKPSYYLKSDELTQCINAPPQYYYLNIAEQKIKPCYSTCLTCSADGTSEVHNCDSCKPNLLRFGKNCLTSCPNYTSSDGSICTNCKSISQYYFNGACVTSIQQNWKLVSEEYNGYEACQGLCCDGYYYDQSTQKCIACHSSCKTCSDGATCLSCIQSTDYIYKNTCITSCPENCYLSNPNICLSCNSVCSKCTNNTPYCVECAKSAIYQLITNDNAVNGINRQCLIACPTDYYPDETNYCTKCTDTGYKIENGKCIASPFNTANCVESLSLNNTSIVQIGSDPFCAKLLLNLKVDCSAEDKNMIESSVIFEWKDLFGGKLDNKNQTLCISSNLLEEGTKLFEVKMVINSQVVTSISQQSYFKKSKLVAKVTNENNLKFIMGFNIYIDASGSYDEAFISENQNSNIKDPLLNFTWACPPQFQEKCAKITDNILEIKSSEYSNIDPNKEFTGEIILTLGKNQEKITKSLKFLLSPAMVNLNNSTTNSTSEQSLADLIEISSKPNVDEIIFQIIFLNSSSTPTDFEYFWTMNSINSDAEYANGRHESSLKVKADIIKIGDNTVELQIKRKGATQSYLKKYTYTKDMAPYGGSCVVDPQMGQSLVTTFTFKMEGWKSQSTPLQYKIYSKTDDKEIMLTNGFILDTKYSTSITPVTSKVFLDVKDANGGVTTVNCNVQIKAKTSLDLNALMNNVYDPQAKILLFECYNTNTPLTANMTSKALDVLSGSLVSQPNKPIASGVFNLLEIGSKAQDAQSQMKVFNITASITDKVKTFVNDQTKLTSLFTTMNNNAQSSSSELVSKVDTLMWKVMDAVQNNIIPGEVKQFNTPSFTLQVAKFSPLNTKSFSVSNDPTMKSTACSNLSVMCLSPERLSKFTAISPQVGITAKYNKDNKIPIKIPPFSKDSFEFYVSDTTTGRRLELDDSKFTINLNIQGLEQNSTQESIGDTLCMQYDREKTSDDVSCETWYDYNSSKGICICNKPGLIVNVLEKTSSNANKLKQFPVPSAKLCIDGFLVVFVITLLTIAFVRDKIDKKKHLTIVDNPKQYFMTRLSAEGFHRYYSFKKLYIYMIKISHPFISVMSLYSPIYSRPLRVIDLLIKIHLSFFFGLLPYYYTTNDEFELVKTQRNIQNRGKLVDDFEAKLSQIINGIIYSVTASIISAICTMILNFIMHRDIGREEASKLATAKRKLHEDIKGITCYDTPLRNMKTKLKALLIILQKKEPRKNIIEDMKLDARPPPVIKLVNNDQDASSSHRLLKYSLISSKAEQCPKLNLSPEIKEEAMEHLEKTSCPCDWEITNECNFEILSTTSKDTTTYVYQVTARVRYFEHMGMESKISGYFYTIIAVPQKLSILIFIRSWLKFIICILLFGFIWYYIAVFTLDIYEHFGNNFFKICVMPLISMLFINLVAVSLLMILASCLVMTWWGKSVPAMKKFSLIKLIYHALVSPLMDTHYQAIQSFKNTSMQEKLKVLCA